MTAGATKLSDQELAALPSAGLARRLAALLYDCFLIGAIWMLLGFVVQLYTGTGTNSLVNGQVQTNPTVDNVLFLVMVTSCLLFYTWFWLRSGQTLGMLAWRLRVQQQNGQRINPLQACQRFVFAWLSFGVFGLGYLWLLFDSKQETWHDKLSNTRVVLLPKEFQLLQ